MNKTIIKGRLTADPETKQTQSGVSVTRFTVAVDRGYAKDGKREADFFPCIAWRERGDFICKWFTKGKEILLEGQMQRHEYKAQDGSNRTAWDLIVDRAEFCGSAPGTKPSATGDDDGFVEIDEGEEMPF